MADTRELQLAIDDEPTAVGVVLAWAARFVVVAAFLFIGLTKFNNDPRSEWVRIFARIGLGQWFRYFTGSVQILGGLLLALPWTLTLGAFLLVCTMIGAAIVDIFVMRSPGFALAPLALLGLVAATWYAGTYGATRRRQ